MEGGGQWERGSQGLHFLSLKEPVLPPVGWDQQRLAITALSPERRVQVSR